MFLFLLLVSCNVTCLCACELWQEIENGNYYFEEWNAHNENDKNRKSIIHTKFPSFIISPKVIEKKSRNENADCRIINMNSYLLHCLNDLTTSWCECARGWFELVRGLLWDLNNTWGLSWKV